MRVALLLLLLPLLGSGGEAQTLAQQEVEVLQLIGSKLRKDWDFSVDPCSKSPGWVNTRGLYVSNVTCDCSFNNYTLCHVVRIQLLRQNLTGVLPEEMANLTYLNYLDLSRNYLGGSIPSSWSSLPLVNLSLHGNHLSGKIPKELGSLPVLKSLQLEGNQFEGPLPPELGNLRSLERLFLSANNFTGELPSTFAMLTNLTDFRIDGNGISGKIPDFIHKWGKINRIDMQGTSMNGPFPSSISLMKSLQELRITELSGQSMPFPQLQNLENLTELVLRNCLISGEIPPYLGNMTNLRVLGYMAPEYATRGFLTDKADVYSFGVVVLEIVSGKSNVGYMPQDKLFYLLDHANILQEQDRLIELVDPNLGSNYSKDEALRMLQVALLCTNSSHARRPGMLNVVSMLDGQAPVQAPEFVPDEDFSQSTSMKVLSLDSPRCVSKDGLSTDKSDSRCSIDEIPMNLSSASG